MMGPEATNLEKRKVYFIGTCRLLNAHLAVFSHWATKCVYHWVCDAWPVLAVCVSCDYKYDTIRYAKRFNMRWKDSLTHSKQHKLLNSKKTFNSQTVHEISATGDKKSTVVLDKVLHQTLTATEHHQSLVLNYTASWWEPVCEQLSHSITWGAMAVTFWLNIERPNYAPSLTRVWRRQEILPWKQQRYIRVEWLRGVHLHQCHRRLLSLWTKHDVLLGPQPLRYDNVARTVSEPESTQEQMCTLSLQTTTE